ncbi:MULTISPECIES: tetratricopeptide repeat protein [unclassified Maridesulfovibrio]|uniref:tetratricopeptide repeat protein n=1 Tax=unclassified Maridesulfovibrio TaxID=2794999 RepID=UPI003B3D56D7
MRKREKIQGVFSAKKKSVIGTGTTKKRTEQTTYWYAEEQENGVLNVQALNTNYIPTGPQAAVEMEMFLKDYHPEPEIYLKKVIPNVDKLEKTISLGESHRAKGESYSAEYEFNKAMSLDELNVRVNFGLGLTYLDRGEMERADDIFKRLIGLESCYEPQHKHLFNEFGISLRKNGMLKQALEYYLRAEKLVEEDENLHMNIARVHFEQGDLKSCLEHLRKALRLNKSLEEACIFLNFLKGKGFIEECTLDQVIEKTADDNKALESLLKSNPTPVIHTTSTQARKNDSLTDELNFL